MFLATEKHTKRILVVDDVADNLFLVQFLLETQGYIVNTADSGEAALAQIEIESVKPDLIILDLMMPRMNGYEVISYLRNHQDLLHIPILLMTADTSVSDRKAKDVGADGIVYKPLDLEQILTKVETFST